MRDMIATHIKLPFVSECNSYLILLKTKLKNKNWLFEPRLDKNFSRYVFQYADKPRSTVIKSNYSNNIICKIMESKKF